MYAITVLALTIQMVGTYFVWPSRWNVPAHLALGFCVTAYLVPGLATDVWGLFDEQTISMYMRINILGAICVVAGLFVGSRMDFFGSFRARLLPLFVVPAAQMRAIGRTKAFAVMGIAGMIAAYFIMGFVPMFAEDPFSAKQFKNEYFEPYYRAAYLFRGSFSILVVVIPILLTTWYVRRSVRPLLLATMAVALIAVSLARQSTAIGILTFLGLVAARTTGRARLFILFSAVFFPLGSAAYLLLGLLTGVESLTTVYSVDSIADIVSSGSPDIFDQLGFLSGFREVGDFTFGRTFLGGLVPGNFPWNPSVWSLTYDNIGADISEMVTGGLRLSSALWGYSSLGWPGVILVCFVSGVLNGSMLAVLKRMPFQASLLGAVLSLAVYTIVGKQIYEFYFLSIHNIPSIVCIVVICFGVVLSASRRRDVRSKLASAPKP